MRFNAALTILTLLLASSPGTAQKAPDKLPVYPAAGSTARVGQKAPGFSLPDTNGKKHTLQEFVGEGKTLVLFWFDPDCQVIRRHFQIEKTFPQLYSSYAGRKVVFVAVSSSDSGRAVAASKADFLSAWRVHSPVLIDSAGTIGRVYGAKSSPHVFIVGSDGVLKYSGAVDNDAKGEKYGDARIPYLTMALDEILAGKPVTEAETKPYGCRIRYAR